MDFPNIPPRGKDASSLRSALAEMLAEMMLNDPDAPDHAKVPVQIISVARSFSQKLHDTVTAVVIPINPQTSEEEMKKAREFLEYIQLMTAGFDNFMEQYKSK